MYICLKFENKKGNGSALLTILNVQTSSSKCTRAFHAVGTRVSRTLSDNIIFLFNEYKAIIFAPRTADARRVLQGSIL